MFKKVLSGIILCNLAISPYFFFECKTQNANAATIENKKPINTTNQILAISRTNLNTKLSKVGDPFSAKVVDNVTANQQILIPCGSIINGQVVKVRKPNRGSLDGYILISINQIQTPQGQTLCLQGQEILGKIISPYTKGNGEKIAETIPTRAAGYGTTIPIDRATDLNGGVIYAIGLGASVTAGAITGFFDPDVGRTRLSTSLYRAYQQTPISGVQGALSKGKEAEISCGDGVIFNLNKTAIARIQDQYYAQLGQPTVATK